MSNEAQSLGTMIDLLHHLYGQKSEAEAVVSDLKARIEAAEAEIIGTLATHNMTGGQGKLAKANIISTNVPIVEDWDQFLEHVKESDMLYLLHRRLSTTAASELLAAGEELPGVGIMNKRRLSITKR